MRALLAKLARASYEARLALALLAISLALALAAAFMAWVLP